MGYLVPGKTYTLLGNQGDDGIAQLFLDDCATNERIKSVSICVKELTERLRLLHSMLSSALMNGAIYEYGPESFRREVRVQHSGRKTTSAFCKNIYGSGNSGRSLFTPEWWKQEVFCGPRSGNEVV